VISRTTPNGEGFAYAIRHHTALASALGIELTRPPSDSAYWLRHSGLWLSGLCFFQQVDVAALCAPIRDWTIAQISEGAGDLDQPWDGTRAVTPSAPQS
jgi:hypothetical protein